MNLLQLLLFNPTLLLLFVIIRPTTLIDIRQWYNSVMIDPSSAFLSFVFNYTFSINSVLIILIYRRFRHDTVNPRPISLFEFLFDIA